jgi:hypothetical protein
MCRGRSASVILTSPPLRAAEVRITTAPLRREKLGRGSIRNRGKKQVVVLPVPMAVKVQAKTSADDQGRCTGRRASRGMGRIPVCNSRRGKCMVPGGAPFSASRVGRMFPYFGPVSQVSVLVISLPACSFAGAPGSPLSRTVSVLWAGAGWTRRASIGRAGLQRGQHTRGAHLARRVLGLASCPALPVPGQCPRLGAAPCEHENSSDALSERPLAGRRNGSSGEYQVALLIAFERLHPGRPVSSP